MVGLKEKVLSGLRWTAGAKFGTQVISWSITLIVIRMLDPDDYGLVAMASIFVGLCLLLNEMGLGAALITVKELTDKILRQAFGLVLLFNIFLFLVLVAGASAIASYFDEPRLTEIVSVLAVQFLFIVFSVIPSARLTRRMEFRSQAIVNIVSELSHGLVTLALAWLGYGVWALVYGMLVKIVVRSIGLNIIDPFLKLPSFNFAGFGAAARFGGIVSANRILWYLYSQSDLFVVGKVLGKTVLGYYSVAVNLASMPLDKIGGVLNQVAFPAYAQLQENKHLAGKYCVKAARAISLFSFPVFFGMSAVAPEIVTVLLGDKWLQAILPLQVLSLVIPLRAVIMSLMPAVTGLGRPEVTFRCLLSACVIIPVSFLVGAKWGLTGISVAYVTSYSVWFGAVMLLVLPVLGLTLRTFLPVFSVPVFWSVAMYGAVYALRFFLSPYSLNPAAVLILLALTGALVYATGLLTISRKTANDVLALIRNRK